MKFKTQAVVISLIRRRLDLTQAEMGKKMGVHAQMISNAERGTMQIPLKRLNKLGISDTFKLMMVRARLKDVANQISKELKIKFTAPIELMF